MATKITARELSYALGVSEATISRIRSGSRRPSIHLMADIEAELGWPVADQVAAYQAGDYASDFAKLVGPVRERELTAR